MLLELELVDDLLTLVRCRGFGPAAAERHISVSALSRRIARLESNLGSLLVERDAGGYRGLTDAGERVLVDGQRLLDLAAQLVRSAREPGARPLRIGVPGLLSDHGPDGMWRELRSRIAEAVPGTRVAVRGVPFAECGSALEDRVVDVMLSQVDPTSSSLESAPLGPVPRILVMARDHPLAGRPTVSVDDVAGLPLLREVSAAPAWFRPWILGDVIPARDARTVAIRSTGFAHAADALRGTAVATVTSGTFLQQARSRWAAAPIRDAPPLTLRADVRRGDRVAAHPDTLRILREVFAPPVPVRS